MELKIIGELRRLMKQKKEGNWFFFNLLIREKNNHELQKDEENP